MSNFQPPKHSNVQQLVLGHNTLWWELPLARQLDLLRRGATLLLGLEVGADPKDAEFPSRVVCN